MSLENGANDTTSQERLSKSGNSSKLSPLERLVNNEYMADAVFKVGKSGTLIHAHKVIITMASEVFFAQFNGQFAEAQQDLHTDPIVVPDVEADIFLELLRYMYCEKANIDYCNMFDVYYGAEKYMLEKLQLVCENAFYSETNEETVLHVFQQNRRYGFAVVDEICLKIICENPIKIFKQQEFLKMDLAALKLITSREKINCGMGQLQQAIQQWETENGEANINLKPFGRLCKKVNFCAEGSMRHNISSMFEISLFKPIALYGIGLLIGADRGCGDSRRTVSIDVYISGSHVPETRVSQETFLVTDELETHEIMFERQILRRNIVCDVHVCKFNELGNANMFTMHSMAIVNGGEVFNKMNLQTTNSFCVSYLLYQVEAP